MVLDHLINLNKNYHNVVNQLNNNLKPTRHLWLKFLANSRRIKNALEDLNSIWQFLNKCSYASAAYEQKQRNWTLLNNGGPQENDKVAQHIPAEEIIPEVQKLPVKVLLYVPNQSVEDRYGLHGSDGRKQCSTIHCSAMWIRLVVGCLFHSAEWTQFILPDVSYQSSDFSKNIFFLSL